MEAIVQTMVSITSGIGSYREARKYIITRYQIPTHWYCKLLAILNFMILKVSHTWPPRHLRQRREEEYILSLIMTISCLANGITLKLTSPGMDRARKR